jgi:mono/diheme cytochrome c family protein
MPVCVVCYLDWDMRGRSWHLPAALAVLVPAILAGWTLTAVFAEQAPSPSASAGALPGDPNAGAQVYSGKGGCTSCHGANLEGGIGAKLNPIQKFPGVTNPLDPNYLRTTVRSGRSGDGFSAQMPSFGPDQLSDTDLNNVISFIISQNKSGASGLDPVTLARSNVLFVSVTVILMVLVVWLLARYNMRWIARRAEVRRQRS